MSQSLALNQPKAQGSFSLRKTLAPIRKVLPLTSSLMKRHSHSPAKTKFRVSGLRTAAMVLLSSVLILALAKRSDAKPPPFYGSTSVTVYGQNTSTKGMQGEDAQFNVREAITTFKVPYALKLGSTELSLTGMGLTGATECDEIPMAETDFKKFAGTLDIAFPISGVPGKFNLDLGLRRVIVDTRECSFGVSTPMGPVTVDVPSEHMADWDYGIRAKWGLGHGEGGFLQSVKFDATEFDAGQAIRKNKWVFSGSVDVRGGWGASVFGDTKSNNVGFGTSKTFGGAGGNFSTLEAGYETASGSLYWSVGVRYDPLLAVFASQTEYGDKSEMVVVSIDPVSAFRKITGRGKSKGGHGH